VRVKEWVLVLMWVWVLVFAGVQLWGCKSESCVLLAIHTRQIKIWKRFRPTRIRGAYGTFKGTTTTRTDNGTCVRP